MNQWMLSVNENGFHAFSLLIGIGEFGCFQIPMGNVEGGRLLQLRVVDELGFSCWWLPAKLSFGFTILIYPVRVLDRFER